MATGDNLIFCPICLDVFITPRALPCLHTFCELCLDEYIKATVAGNRALTRFDCPTCRQMVPAPTSDPCDKWAGQFVLNHMIVTLIDEKKAGNTETRSVSDKMLKSSPFKPTQVDTTPTIEDPVKPPNKHDEEDEAPATEMSGQRGEGPPQHFPPCHRGPRGHRPRHWPPPHWPRCGPPPQGGPPPFGPPPHGGPPPFGPPPHGGPPLHRLRHHHRPHSGRHHRGHCHRPPHI